MFKLITKNDSFTVGRTVCKLIVLRNQHSEEAEAAAKESQPEMIVFLGERPDNPGKSVTNAIELLAQKVYGGIVKPLGIKPWEVCWVECYIDQEPFTMDVVTFKHDREIGAEECWEDPKWADVSRNHPFPEGFS
jgi:hypothetical protein